MEENANKLHFKCTDFNSSARVTVHAECICVFIEILSSSLNTMLIIDKHCSDICCDESLAPQIDRRSNYVKTVTWKSLFAISTGKTRYIKHRKY